MQIEQKDSGTVRGLEFQSCDVNRRYPLIKLQIEERSLEHSQESRTRRFVNVILQINLKT